MAGSLRSNPLPKSHGQSAEEILVKVEQHGFRPLQPSRMMVRTESAFFHKETQCEKEGEVRWYRGARRPHEDAGVLF